MWDVSFSSCSFPSLSLPRRLLNVVAIGRLGSRLAGMQGEEGRNHCDVRCLLLLAHTRCTAAHSEQTLNMAPRRQSCFYSTPRYYHSKHTNTQNTQMLACGPRRYSSAGPAYAARDHTLSVAGKTQFAPPGRVRVAGSTAVLPLAFPWLCRASASGAEVAILQPFPHKDASRPFAALSGIVRRCDKPSVPSRCGERDPAARSHSY
mmetsp:Transcript_38275/g.95831  ORF Transcript_38275/g.95831 Transcript_38275/m.95831 type:complete len:205 (+) Transcript_38275:1547-2161(+)